MAGDLRRLAVGKLDLRVRRIEEQLAPPYVPCQGCGGICVDGYVPAVRDGVIRSYQDMCGCREHPGCFAVREADRLST